MFLVVSFDQVFDDGAGFPECKACVGILDGGGAAVGVELFVGGLFEVCLCCGRGSMSMMDFVRWDDRITYGQS